MQTNMARRTVLVAAPWLRRWARRVVVAVSLAGALEALPAAAQVSAGPARAVEYYHLDALGSVRVVTDASGAVVSRHDYAPFGEELTPPNPPTERRLFTGKERDFETGFDYFGARYYRADVGRFTTIDPVYTWSENLVDPQRWNRYSYVRNNPLKYVDSDGRMPVPLIALWAQRVLSSPTVQRAGAWAQTQGVAAWNWATRVFNSPAGQEAVQTVAELATGAQAPSSILATKTEARAALEGIEGVGTAANRFFRDATAKSTNFKISDLGEGVRRLEFFSPAKNAGYGKRYIQDVDAAGNVVREFKETVGPSGVIETKWVHGGPK